MPSVAPALSWHFRHASMFSRYAVALCARRCSWCTITSGVWSGCSLAFSAALTEEIGLMDEEYFMYFEEVDWQYRAKRFGVSTKVIPESRLYHYGSLSLGNRSAFYHYYRNRAATRFNKRFYGPAFAIVSAFLLSAVTTVKEYKNPTLAWSGIKGAFKGVAMSVE